SDASTRYLVCADAKTGVVLWRQALTWPQLTSRFTDSVGPVVSREGIVFVYDQAPRYHYGGGGYRRGVSITEGPRTTELMQAFVRNSLNTLVTAARAYLGETAPSGTPPSTLAPGLNIARSRLQHKPGLVVSYKTSLKLAAPDGSWHIDGRLEQQMNLIHAPTYHVRTFSATNGQPGPAVQLPMGRLYSEMNHLVLRHPPLSDELKAARGLRELHLGVDLPDGPGYPVLAGGEFAATRGFDLFFRWNPRADRAGPTLQEMMVDHPLPGSDPAHRHTAQFQGFPPLLYSRGYLVGEDSSHRFLAQVYGAAVDPRERAWHLDLHTTVGIPASDDKMIYVSLGGPGATRGITAIDGAAGAPVWRYAPAGLPSDAVQLGPGRRRPDAVGPETLEMKFLWELGPGQRQQDDSPPWLFSSLPPGHWSNAGLVVGGGRVYGEVNGTIVALDQATGAVQWQCALPPRTFVRSLVATPDYVIACISRTVGARPAVWEPISGTDHTLLALNREDGKLLWQDVTPRPGNLTLAGGMVYFSNGGLHAYGPAERTFRLAIDSPKAEDYRRTTEAAPAEGEAREAATPALAENEAAPAPAPQKSDPALADATVLRLAWGEPLPQMLEKLHLRRQAAPGVPLLLSLDRLNAARSAWTDAATQPPFTPQWREEYVKVCRELAAARPDYFEILPEINVYLTHAPKQRAAVKALVETLIREIHAVSPTTCVVVSFNVEVLAGTYGRGAYRPFGELVLPRKAAPGESLAVAAAADAVGLTSYPQAALKQPTDVPPDYLLSFRKVLGERPFLVTKLAVKLDAAVGPPAVVQQPQATWLRRLLQNCYWLDAALVAYPDLVAEEARRAASPLALRVGAEARLGLGVWRDVFGWQSVERLTLAAQRDPDAGPDTEPEPK
ncbi:MAG TPA: PQQ-binding-like beta-propeller repeat protein, partial [Armatimonadota bacterium]|nr:PQQ-binding-like beta-propeller repeat protein [Armatimonadota bacterium]